MLFRFRLVILYVVGIRYLRLDCGSIHSFIYLILCLLTTLILILCSSSEMLIPIDGPFNFSGTQQVWTRALFFPPNYLNTIIDGAPKLPRSQLLIYHPPSFESRWPSNSLSNLALMVQPFPSKLLLISQ